MCSKVLNGHIILTDTSITTILAPEMTYTPFSHPFSMRWLVGAKLLGGCEIYKPCRTDFRRLERRAGFSFGTGLSTTYLATQNLGVRFSTDYDVAPPVVRSSRERLHKLTFSMEVCAVF